MLTPNLTGWRAQSVTKWVPCNSFPVATPLDMGCTSNKWTRPKLHRVRVLKLHTSSQRDEKRPGLVMKATQGFSPPWLRIGGANGSLQGDHTSKLMATTPRQTLVSIFQTLFGESVLFCCHTIWPQVWTKPRAARWAQNPSGSRVEATCQGPPKTCHLRCKVSLLKVKHFYSEEIRHLGNSRNNISTSFQLNPKKSTVRLWILEGLH